MLQIHVPTERKPAHHVVSLATEPCVHNTELCSFARGVSENTAVDPWPSFIRHKRRHGREEGILSTGESAQYFQQTLSSSVTFVEIGW